MSEITVSSPFPRSELPALYLWLDRVWASVCDDAIPHDLDSWMDSQFASQAKTWGVYKDGHLGGYVEAREATIAFPDWSPQTATVQCVFKRDFWGFANTVPAMNLVLEELFNEGAEILAMRIFRRNRAIRDLAIALGFSDIGKIDTGQTADGESLEVHLYLLTRAEWQWRHAKKAEVANVS